MTEKRFIETISSGIVMDNQTGKEYNCEMRIDDDFLNLVNIIANENEQLKEKLNEIKNGLTSDLENGIGEQPIAVSMYLQSIIDLIGDVE